MIYSSDVHSHDGLVVDDFHNLEGRQARPDPGMT